MKMLKKTAIVIFVLLMAACSSKDKKVHIPATIIPQEQMVQVLVDFHLAEAAIQRAKQDGRDVNMISNFYYASLLKKHHITRKKFNESLLFYSNNLKELENIYKDVVTELSKTQSKIVSRKI